AGLAAGAAQFAAPFIIKARGETPIKLGVLLPKSGPYAIQGENGHNGAQIAVQDIGASVLDRPVEIVWLDEANPQTSQQNMRRLIEQEQVVAVQGGVSSGDVLAVMPLAERQKTLLMATGPNATEITGKNCNRYTFRVDLPNRVTVRSTYPTLAKNGKSWYFIVASYAWGIDAYEQMKEQLVNDGGKAVGYDQAPLGTSDFSSYLLKVREAQPDVLYLGLGGSDLTSFLKQFHDIGLTGQIPISSPIVNDSDLWAAGPEAATGLYPKIWNYSGPHLAGKSEEFTKNYQAKFNMPPEVEAWQDWFGATAILTAIKESKSTEVADLIDFLENHKFDGYKDMPIYFRPWDHQLIQPILIAKIKDEITDQYDYFDIIGENPTDPGKLEEFFGSKQDVACNLQQA
ncbi:MAG: ABC transporter substrate-binding protein, partial [Geminicoccaceae bacterium]